MIPFEEARARLLALAHARPKKREIVVLGEALGRSLAEDVFAESDYPVTDGSTMDGYAVRASTISTGAWLPVRGESRAGGVAAALEPGSAMRIFTGAELPDGADTVIAQECAARDGDRVRFEAVPRVGACVRRRGADLTMGAIAISRGVRLSPSALSLAASLDRATLCVHARPRVVILPTGDELRAPGSAARAGSLPESNGVGLAAAARAAGADVVVFEPTPDDPEATFEAIVRGLRDSDVLVPVGGVSVGDHDCVRPALERAGVAIDFFRVAIRPGKPMAVGQKQDHLIVALPGNPASALVTFALFVRPLLLSLAGVGDPLPRVLRARAGVRFSHAPGRLTFTRAVLTAEAGELVVRAAQNQASGALTSMTEANALALVPTDVESVDEGAAIDVLPYETIGLSAC